MLHEKINVLASQSQSWQKFWIFFLCCSRIFVKCLVDNFECECAKTIKKAKKPCLGVLKRAIQVQIFPFVESRVFTCQNFLQIKVRFFLSVNQEFLANRRLLFSKFRFFIYRVKSLKSKFPSIQIQMFSSSESLSFCCAVVVLEWSSSPKTLFYESLFDGVQPVFRQLRIHTRQYLDKYCMNQSESRKELYNPK